MAGLFDSPQSDQRYLLEIESLVVAVFREASGLVSEREIVDLDEGGVVQARKLIGPYARGTFHLRSGDAEDTPLYDWFERSESQSAFTTSRRSGNVIQIDGRGEELMRWRFRMALITQWNGPPEKPKPGLSYAVELVGITHEGLEMILR